MAAWESADVTLPPSRKAIDRLGDELRSAAAPSDAALNALQGWRVLHEEALVRVETRLRDELNLEPGVRLKTTLTILDKLRRMPDLQLSRMQDIAGARIVAEASLTEQDELVARIAPLFGPDARLVDRRAKPSHGYRAVHVVVKSEGISVEIQIRTALQHLWAMVGEGFAAQWGRTLQYGLDPRDPDVPAASTLPAVTRRDVIETLRRWSDEIAHVEQSRDTLQRVLRLQSPTAAHAAGGDVFEASTTYRAEPEEWPALEKLSRIAGALSC